MPACKNSTRPNRSTPPAAPPPPAAGEDGTPEAAAAAAAAPPAAAPATPAADATTTGPTGSGWIISLRGYHFHNDPLKPPESRERYVRKTLIKNLKSGKIAVPEKARVENGPAEIDLKKLGFAFPIVRPADGGHEYEASMNWRYTIEASDEDAGAATDASRKSGEGKTVPAPRFDFIVELCWLDEPPKEETPATEEGAPPASEPAPAAAPPVAVAGDEQPPADAVAAPPLGCAARGRGAPRRLTRPTRRSPCLPPAMCRLAMRRRPILRRRRNRQRLTLPPRPRRPPQQTPSRDARPWIRSRFIYAC